MENWIPTTPVPVNEPVSSFLPGDPATRALKEQLAKFSGENVEIPIIIDGKEFHSGKTEEIHPPHHTALTLGKFHKADAGHVEKAIQGSLRAFAEWSRTPAESRAAIFLKAAELLATKYRPILNAATMLGQSKTCHQAEIDSACELVDFYRFNVAFQRQLYAHQPISGPGEWNQVSYRPLEGFVFAVTPFNFTSIAGNLPTAPALMGNVVLWKPASTAVYSGYFIYKLLEEAGLPPGVIQFLPGSGAEVGNPILASEHLAGIHFTGSTGVFNSMWKTIGENIGKYRTYPRLVGETGGKDFIFAHESADVDALATAMIRGAFEYQGQKCSAASRAYIPKNLWPRLKERLIEELRTVRIGDVSDFSNFMGAVIDRNSFKKLKGHIDQARNASDAKVIAGGECSDETGYFIHPTVIETTNPRYNTMCEELFGPVLTLHVYDENNFREMLKTCDQTSPYALTGAIFARDRYVINEALSTLTHSAGNFYINNKPTGAVVGRQPFGGARASGTNDKAGSLFNLLRWTSMRTVCETFVPPTDYRYPFLTGK